MAPNPRRQDERLDALYAQIPKLECRGYCHDSCGPIAMSLRERERIERRVGEPVAAPGMTCSMLDSCNRCRVYEIRPMICRLWGVIESMPCHYGCRPEGGLMTDAEGARLIAEADIIGGDPGGRDEALMRALEEAKEMYGEGGLERAIRKFMRHHTMRPSLAGRRPDTLEKEYGHHSHTKPQT